MLLPKRSLLKVAISSLLLCAVVSLASAEGGLDVKPTPVKTPPPTYPVQLKRNGVTGVVAVKVEIDEEGSVASCSVSKSTNPEFDSAAVSAVKSWKFKPGQKNGSPVKTTIVIPISFTLDE